MLFFLIVYISICEQEFVSDWMTDSVNETHCFNTKWIKNVFAEEQRILKTIGDWRQTRNYNKNFNNCYLIAVNLRFIFRWDIFYCNQILVLHCNKNSLYSYHFITEKSFKRNYCSCFYCRFYEWSTNCLEKIWKNLKKPVVKKVLMWKFIVPLLWWNIWIFCHAVG